MNARDLMLLDLRETRRRFLTVARAVPDDLLAWRPDAQAITTGEMIRHVLMHDLSWLRILQEGRLPDTEERQRFWDEPPFTTVEAEIERGAPFHAAFIAYVEALDPADFDQKMVEWPHKPIVRSLGDTLERKSYHDAVHTGQLLAYQRTLGVARPDIWD